MTQQLSNFTHKRLSLIFFLTFAFWGISAFIHNGKSPFWHCHYDQHTRQAQSWLEGRVDLAENPSWLEISAYDGKWFNSFPVTPTFFELPWVVFFKSNTPNGFAMFLMMFVVLVAMTRFGISLGWSFWHAFGLAFVFGFGSNTLFMLVQGGVWNQGQIYGYSLCLLGVYFLSVKKSVAGFFCLSLAVGCRPFYLFYFPFFFALDRYFTPNKKIIQRLNTSVLAMIPFGLFLAVYNYIRFDDFLEFGHSYLPHSESLSEGIFDFAYFSRNFEHTFLKIPNFKRTIFFLEFHGRGTAFWITSPLFLISLFYLIRRILRPGKNDPQVRHIFFSAILSLLIVWFGLLLHESNGWFQFGYRYVIDILPIGLIIFYFSVRRISPWLVPLAIWSILINWYGLFWTRYWPMV